MSSIIGKKLGMTQLYDESGAVVPVTIIEAEDCRILAIRDKENDGYDAIQVACGKRNAKNLTKAVKGHIAKCKQDVSPAFIKELRVSEKSSFEVGQDLSVEQFEVGKYVDVTGQSKGRGFQGVVKRYNFGGGRASHGGDWTRKPGSIGMCEFPAKVYKGRKMPGQMGNVTKTVLGLKVVSVRKEDNLIFVKGAIPGPKGGIVTVRNAKKKSA